MPDEPLSKLESAFRTMQASGKTTPAPHAHGHSKDTVCWTGLQTDCYGYKARSGHAACCYRANRFLPPGHFISHDKSTNRESPST